VPRNVSLDEFRIVAQGTKKSPFPELDQFLLEMLKPISAIVQIRNWTITFSELKLARHIHYRVNFENKRLI
jgi:hypothetical protein